MSEYIFGFFGLAVFILLFIFFFIWITKSNVIKISFKYLFTNKVSSLLSVCAITIAFFTIHFSLISQFNFLNGIENYIRKMYGDIDGVIFDRTGGSISIEVYNKISSSLIQERIETLPIFYDEINIKNRNISLIGIYKEQNSFSINDNFYKEELKKLIEQIDSNEVIISTDIAKQLNLNRNERINLYEKEYIIKEIVDPNGLLGFTKGNLNTIGSIIVPVNFVEKSPNLILVNSLDAYDIEALTRVIQQKIVLAKNTLVFDELKEKTINLLTNADAPIRHSQLIFIVSIPIFLSALLVLTIISLMIIDRRKIEISTLRAIGYTNLDVTLIFLTEFFIYLFVASIIQIVIIFLFVNFINNLWLENYIFPKTYITYIQLDNNLDINIILLILFNTLFLGSIIFALIFSRIININIATGLKNIPTPEYKPFNLKNNTFSILIILLGILGLNTIFNNLITDPLIYDTILYVSLIGILGGSINLIRQIFSSKRYKIISYSTLVFIFISIFSLSTDLFKSLKTDLIFIISNAIIFSLSITILLVLNIEIFTKIFKFIQNRISYIVIGIRYSSISPFKTILFVCIITILLITPGIGLLINQYIFSEQKKIIENLQYNLIVNDPLNTLNLDVLNNEKIQTIGMISSQGIFMPEYTYSQIEYFDPKAPLPVRGDDKFRDVLTSLDENLFESIGSIDTKVLNIKTEFLENDRYVLLGRNYKRRASNTNLRPELKIGDKVKIEFFDGTTIEREVIGIIDIPKGFEYSEQFLNFANLGNYGIYISNIDAINLTENKNILLPRVFYVKTKDHELPSELVDKIKTYTGTTIINQLDKVNENIAISNNILSLVNKGVIISFILVTLSISILIIKSIIDKHEQVSILWFIGKSKNFIASIFATEYITFILVSVFVTICIFCFLYLLVPQIFNFIKIEEFLISYLDISKIFIFISLIYILVPFIKMYTTNNFNIKSKVE